MSRAKAKAIKFSEGSVIIVGEGAQQQLFKVLEDFDGKDEKGNIKAALLKESTRADGNIQFHVDKTIEVPIKVKPKRVFDVEVIPAKGKGRGKQPETIQFNQNQLELEPVQQFQVKCGKAQLKNQFSESSAEEKKPQLVEKKLGLKKTALKTEYEDRKPILIKGGKRASSGEQSSESDEDSPQPQKIKVVRNTRGRKPATQAVKQEPQKVEKKEIDQKIKSNNGLIPGVSNINYPNQGQELVKVNLIPPAIESAQYPEDFPQFEEHAKEYIEENQNTREEDKSIIDPRLEVDLQAKQQAGKYEIVVKSGQPYSLIMTKVDVANGLASENVFYKMQLIHESNKDVYILFTRWGRIGTPGQLQMKPFDKPNAIKEFHSIFKSKSGNVWEEIIAGKPFQKQPKKYLLQNISIKKNYKQLMQPFDFSRKNKNPHPQHHLEKNLARFLLQFCQVKLYQRELQQIRVAHEFLPLESLEKDLLYRAKNILKELEEFALELERERKEHKLNHERIFELFASINEKSSRYYELIPCIDYRNEPLPPLETLQQLIYHLGHKEYIIYDEEQVRTRYLVEIDTQSQEDKFL